jgi:hypothetical protein
LLIHSVSRGRNWARIIYSVFVALASLLILVSLIFKTDQMSISQRLVSALLLGAYGVVVALLYQRDSSRWFRRGRASAT